MRTFYLNTLFTISLGCFILISFQGNAQFNNKPQSGEENLEKDERKATYYFTEGVKYFILEDFEKAQKLFEKSLEYDKNNPAAHYKIAKILTEKKELNQALHHAQQALELNDENQYYYLINAEILTKQSNFNQAAEIYEELLAKVTDKERYMFELAALYLYQNKYDKAIEVYNKAEDKYGIQKKITYQKQKIYLKTNKLDKAIEEGEALIEAFPGEPEFVTHLAEILISNGREEDAIPYLEDLLNQRPENPKGNLMLGKIYFEKNNWEQATNNLSKAFKSQNLEYNPKVKFIANHLKDLPDRDLEKLLKELGEKLVKAHPTVGKAYVINGDLYSTTGNKKQAKAHYARSLKFEESNFNVWQNLISLEYETGQMDSVIDHTDKALELFPNQGALYYYNGAAHLQKKNFSEAVSNLERGRRMASNNNKQLLSVINGMLGDAYHAQEELKKSDEAYKNALEYNPNNKHVLNNYGYYLAERNENLDYAYKLSSKLMKLNSNDPTFLDTHAWVLYKRQEYKKALKYLKKAIENGGESGTIIEHYGDVLFKLGNTEQAVNQWKKAKEMDDTSDLIEKKIADGKLYE